MDQRIFGGWWLDALRPDDAAGGERIPTTAAHIALDPLHPLFDPGAVHARLARRRSTLKRALLDQSLVSGIGNIYADEALWGAGLHPERPTERMRRADTLRLMAAVQDVMRRALEVGARASTRSTSTWTGDRATSPAPWRPTGAPGSRVAAAPPRGSTPASSASRS